MRVVRSDRRPEELPRGAVVTVGNYDGVHRGQRSILERVVTRARERGLLSALVTFDPHPLALLRPEGAPPKLTTESQRQRLLSETGLDELWVVPFTHEFSQLSAAEFVESILVEGLGAKEVHVGSRFAFGRGREGDLRRLIELGRTCGFDAAGHLELLHDGAPVSSTRIREAVSAGRVELAADLLGRPYSFAGRVVRGDRVGHQLGFPTANLVSEGNLMPGDGVYVTVALEVEGHGVWPGVTNVGVRPTREGRPVRRVESHLFDFEGDLYDRRLELDFLRRLRGERRFPSLEALREQIAADAALGREYFRTAPRSQDPEKGRSRWPVTR